MGGRFSIVGGFTAFVKSVPALNHPVPCPRSDFLRAKSAGR